MTIAKVDEEYQITLPLDVRESLGLKRRDSLEVKVIGGTIVMIPISVPTLSHTDRLYGKHRELWSGEDAVAYIRRKERAI